MELFDYRDAIFSDDRKHRFLLTRAWDESKPTIAFIGLNPSTANELTDDPTIRRVIGFARSFGYGKVFMQNLFSYVTPYPHELKKCGSMINDSNTDYLLRYAKWQSNAVVFCWGNFDVLGRDKVALDMFPNAYCLGKNANGSPKHPLYLKSDTKLILYN